jgi:hypothetical protein
VFLFLLLFSLVPRIRVYLDDALLGDRWFRYQHNDLLFWLTVSALPFFVAGFGAWLYSRFLKSILPDSPLLLLILPALVAVTCFQSYAWATSYPVGGETTEFRGGGKTGCVSKAGIKVLDSIYEDVECIGFDEPLAMSHLVGNGGEDYIPVKLGGKWGFLDRSLKMAIAPQFDETFPEAHWGLRPVRKGGKWGFIHARSGEMAIPFEFDSADSFNYVEGMSSPWAPVSMSGKWGYIDRLGRVRIPFQFDNAESLWSGNFYELQDRARRADKLNPWRTFLMTVTEPASGSPAWTRVRVGDLWGVVNSNGQFILPPSIPNEYETLLQCDTRTPECYWHENLGNANRVALSAKTSWKCDPLTPGTVSALNRCIPEGAK